MIEIIPAIDIMDGKCVRLSQGDFSQKKIYCDNPVEMAKQFEEAGFRRLHLVDLDGARQGKMANLSVLKNISENTGLKIDFGGGIKTDEDIQSVFDAGAAIANIGSIAVKKPEIVYKWLKEFGADKILLGADVWEGKIAIGGWQEQTDRSVFDFIQQYTEVGAVNFFCTDVARDGLLEGVSLDLYQAIISQFPEINLIASGGVAGIADIDALQQAGCKGVIIGKAIYEGNVSLSGLAKTYCLPSPLGEGLRVRREKKEFLEAPLKDFKKYLN